MVEISIIGIDWAKNIFQVHGTTADGRPAFSKKVRRSKLLSLLANVPTCIVAMEACASSHYWGREIGALGHTVKMIPPIYVKPYVKRQKNDANDAEAIAEAASRPTLRFVAVKSAEKQASGMALRTRDLLVRQKTQTINALR
ncbi:IS110 family transposase [Sulfitobacter sp. MF3-043]|uniref:IS110 family transposase n=1 Tax=Sulfitobacter sediminivivens TaxID=3252902 RepID=UPI0036DD9529